MKNVILGLMLTVLTCRAELALANDLFDKYRIACSSKQISELQDAVMQAKELASKASAVLPPVNSSGGVRFKRWFGGPEGDYAPLIKNVYDEMQVTLLLQKYWCLPPNSTTPEQWIHTNAFVLRGKVGEIFVLSNFFTLPVTGKASRGGTIVHEAAHQSSLLKIVDDDIDGDGKNDYGSAAAEKRAAKYPDNARKNSDNYKYFSEDVVYQIP
ncbi:M35 family metallo-endopeptidase [Pseudomonas frederiksbergensis]|uniref:M35 family metallo-endopeptidase n=1 Tax=Pseudomonas frederiksbergensis TaxID=104087 RepID=UPI003D262D3F